MISGCSDKICIDYLSEPLCTGDLGVVYGETISI